MKTLFDLRNHSAMDLCVLQTAIEVVMNTCTSEDMKDTKETLLAYKNIVSQATSVAIERQANEDADAAIKALVQSN
jgi:hypothetical protein